jgi:hypothetical protein
VRRTAAIPGSRHARNEPTRETRALVLARDNWQCVGCGQSVGGDWSWWSLQHRVARGVGGGNTAENLVTLCGSATSRGCHLLCEQRNPEMHERGLWLRSDEDPAEVPIVVLTPDGGYTRWLTPDGLYSAEAPGERAS